MTHSDVVEWNDFVSDDLQKTTKLLGTGSKPFRETLAPWPKVANEAAIDASYQPRAETGGLAQLLFDSFSQPIPAGTRSAGMNIRQMLYRTDPYQIDIQLEAQPEGNRLLVTGQLLDVSHPEIVGRDVQVTLSDGGENDVNTMTNQFGEFRGEVEDSGYLDLSFLGPIGKPIFILLRRAGLKSSV